MKSESHLSWPIRFETSSTYGIVLHGSRWKVFCRLEGNPLSTVHTGSPGAYVLHCNEEKSIDQTFTRRKRLCLQNKLNGKMVTLVDQPDAAIGSSPEV